MLLYTEKRKTGMKYRNEIKYICTEQQLVLIENRIKAVCKKDSHVGEKGVYSIRSMYFDDYENTYYWENESGTIPREKFRIRIYNGNTDFIVLECKRKENTKVYKDSCPLTYEQCRKIIQGTFAWPVQGEKQLTDGQIRLLNHFFLEYSTRPLRAKVIVEYERTPYVYPMGNVRITFDRNISGASQVQSFLEPDLRLRPVMPPQQHVLEVKYDELMPDFLYNAMQIKGIRQTAYSKYYICRKFCG